MEQIVICLSMVQNFTNLKQKILKLQPPLCPGKISKDWSADIMKQTGFNGYVYDFSVDYDGTDVGALVDIPKYLMKKTNIV